MMFIQKILLIAEACQASGLVKRIEKAGKMPLVKKCVKWFFIVWTAVSLLLIFSDYLAMIFR